jgi:hypothetical protein
MATSGRIINTQIDKECIEDVVRSLSRQTDEVKAVDCSYLRETHCLKGGNPATDSDHLGILHFNDHALKLLKHDLLQRKKRKTETNFITSRYSDVTENTSGQSPVEDYQSQFPKINPLQSKQIHTRYRQHEDPGVKNDISSRSYSRKMLQMFLDQSGSEELLIAQDFREMQKGRDNEIANVQDLQPERPSCKAKKKSKEEKGLQENRYRRTDLFTGRLPCCNDEGDDGDWKVDNKLKGTYKNDRFQSIRMMDNDEGLTEKRENPLERGFLGKSMADFYTGTPKRRSSTELPRTQSQGSNHKSSSRTEATGPSLALPSQTDVEQHDHSRCISDASKIKSDITGLTGLFNRTPITQKREWTYHDRKITEEYLDPTATILEINKAIVSRQSKLKRNVTFSSVFIRDYERILGNNPSCTSGPSLALGWRYQSERKFSLDTFERCKGKLRRGSQLILSRESREMILLELGYSKKDLASAVRNNIKSKNQRRQTVTNLSASTVEESLENAGRRVCSLFLGGRKNES